MRIIDFHETPIEEFDNQMAQSDRITTLLSAKAMNYLNLIGKEPKMMGDMFGGAQLMEHFAGSCAVMFFSIGGRQEIALWAFDREGRKQCEVLMSIYVQREMEQGTDRLEA